MCTSIRSCMRSKLTKGDQKYAVALTAKIDGDTIHHLFPNLRQLLNFQRTFLIRFESIAEVPWPDQRWGLAFMERVSLS
jgi:cell division control protein 24